MYTSWLGSAGRLLKRNGMNGTFGTDATALRLDNLIFNPTQGSRSGNLGLEGGTAMRLGEFDIQPRPRAAATATLGWRAEPRSS